MKPKIKHIKERHRQNGQLSEMKILDSAYQEIMRTIGKKLPESGGILLGNREDFVIQKFIFDPKGYTSGAAYDPDVEFVNNAIKREWEENQLALLGFIHSHPRGCSRLSGDYGNSTGDIGYIKAILKAIPALQKFLVPIMYSPADGKELHIFPYVAYRGQEDDYQTANLRIIKDEEYKALKTVEKEPAANEFIFNPSRLNGSVDVNLMANSRVVCVGVGGSNGICESLVRTGLGNLTIIDFDTVDENNLVTQGYYISDIGRPKVDALRDRLLNINPKLNVQAINGNFLELSEKTEQSIFQGCDLLLMMTDNFHAQAHGNVNGLKYQVPVVFAMMYEKARCSEITFTIPGITPGCHRCAVSSRYQAYLNEGYENDITSTGSTNFHTSYLNSSIGLLSLAILHRDTEGYEFSSWFGEKWERNLIQLRTSPFYESQLFAKTFAGNERVKCFDSIWQKIEPETPPKYKPCPDCFGLGDLSLSSKFIRLLQNPIVKKLVELTDFPKILSSSEWLKRANKIK